MFGANRNSFQNHRDVAELLLDGDVQLVYSSLRLPLLITPTRITRGTIKSGIR